jgi:hypothetical protein
MFSASTDVGTYPIVIKLSDGFNIVSYTLEVLVFSNPAFSTPLMDQSATVGSPPVTYVLPSYSDSGNITLTTAKLHMTSLPSFITFSGTTYTITPTLPSQAGIQTI